MSSIVALLHQTAQSKQWLLAMIQHLAIRCDCVKTVGGSGCQLKENGKAEWSCFHFKSASSFKSYRLLTGAGPKCASSSKIVPLTRFSTVARTPLSSNTQASKKKIPKKSCFLWTLRVRTPSKRIIHLKWPVGVFSRGKFIFFHFRQNNECVCKKVFFSVKLEIFFARKSLQATNTTSINIFLRILNRLNTIGSVLSPSRINV